MKLITFLVFQLFWTAAGAHAGFDPSQAAEPYRTFGIERSATNEEIQTRYRELLKQYHPDRVNLSGVDLKTATAISQNVNVAYEWLKKNHVRLEMRQALTKIEVDSVLRFAWQAGMNAGKTLDAMNAAARNGGALAQIDQWFESAKTKPDFLLFYLEVARLHPDARRLEKLRSLDSSVLGPLRGRFDETLRAMARAKPELADKVNAILFPVTQPNYFQASETIKAELRTLRAMPRADLRRGLGDLAREAGDGRFSAVGNKLFQDAVASFLEEEFLRAGATVKTAAVEPFLTLLGDETRVLELRLELLRLSADHPTLVDGAIEAARALRALTVVEGNGFELIKAKVHLHDYHAGLARLMKAIAEGDARLSGGSRAENALQEMLLELALRAHRSGNSDAKQLIRSLVDAIEKSGDARGADILSKLAVELEPRRQTELVLGSLEAPAELQKIIRGLRGVARTCRSFF